MSLNKFTTSADYLQKQYLNLGCNAIKCTTLEVNGNSEVKGSVSGSYTPFIVGHDGSTTTNVIALYNIIGNNNNAILNINFRCRLVVASSSTFYILVVSLPTGYKTRELGSVSGNIHCINGNDDNYSAYTLSSTVGTGQMGILFNSNTSTSSIPIGTGQNYVNCSVMMEVEKV